MSCLYNSIQMFVYLGDRFTGRIVVMREDAQTADEQSKPNSSAGVHQSLAESVGAASFAEHNKTRAPSDMMLVIGRRSHYVNQMINSSRGDGT